MTKKILSLLGASAVASSVFAGGYTVTLNNTVVSQYYFRGVEVAGAEGGVHIQPAVDVTFGDTSIGIWSSHSVTEKNDFHEFDLYGSYNFKVSDTVTVPVGFTYYYYPTADISSGLYRSTYEVFAGVSTQVAGVTLTPKAYYDFKLEMWTLEGNAAYSVPLKDLGTSLDFSAALGYWDSSDFVRNAEVSATNYYYSIGVTVPYALSENATLFAGVAYTDGFEGEVDDVETDFGVGQIVYSLGIKASF